MRPKRTRKRPIHRGVYIHRVGGHDAGYRTRIRYFDLLAGKVVRQSADQILRQPGQIYPLTPAGQLEASDRCYAAEEVVTMRQDSTVTVTQLRERWLGRTRTRKGGSMKESTTKTNLERTQPFNDVYGAEPIGAIDRRIAQAWADTHSPTHIVALKAMFSFAVARDELTVSPFASVEYERGEGNGKVNPPSEEEVERLIACAYRADQMFGAWLELACFTALRPGEIDALRWKDLDPTLRRARIRRQWNSKVNKPTLPKNGQERSVSTAGRARSALLKARVFSGVKDGEDGWVFLNRKGNHFTPSSRATYWKSARDGAAIVGNPTLYLCTRHFAGWYLIHIAGMESEDVAIQFGHTDGGQLIRKVYGHRNEDWALDRVAAAQEKLELERQQQQKSTFRIVEGGAS